MALQPKIVNDTVMTMDISIYRYEFGSLTSGLLFSEPINTRQRSINKSGMFNTSTMNVNAWDPTFRRYLLNVLCRANKIFANNVSEPSETFIL